MSNYATSIFEQSIGIDSFIAVFLKSIQREEGLSTCLIKLDFGKVKALGMALSPQEPPISVLSLRKPYLKKPLKSLKPVPRQGGS
jgi:hypothetical protein